MPVEIARSLRAVAGLLMLLGFVGWFGVFLYAAGPLAKVIPDDVELPLAELSGVAVDGEGRIVCASQAYSRIQVHDRAGRFIRGWRVDAAGGMLDMELGADERIHVYAVRKKAHYVFNVRGELLEKGDIADHAFSHGRPAGCRDRAGNVYEIRRPSIWPHVVKTTPAGEESVVVRPRLYLWLVQGPFPAWFFAAFGIVLLGLTEKYVEQQETEEDTGDGFPPPPGPEGTRNPFE